MDRPLSAEEYQLIRWMLEHGSPEAPAFLPQLERAKATSFRCACGCPTIDLIVDGQPVPDGGLHILADFVFGTEADLSGAFVFEKNGVLAGLEVYGLAGDAPQALPSPQSLQPFPVVAGRVD